MQIIYLPENSKKTTPLQIRLTMYYSTDSGITRAGFIAVMAAIGEKNEI